MGALHAMKVELSSAATYDRIKTIEREAAAIAILYAEVDRVRQRAQDVIAHANHRIGEELRAAPKAIGGGIYQARFTGNTLLPVKPATRKEMVGSKTKASRLQRLAEIPLAVVESTIADLHAKGMDATVTAIMKAVAGDETKARRQESRSAPPIADGMEMRIGDCREVLADVPPNSVPLVLTDPPYGDKAEPLYRWLAEWAARVLIPGGSLICYTGQSRLNRDMRIFDEHLRYWWTMAMLHTRSQRLPGKFILVGFKPVLWYVKERRRGRTLVPDILRPPQPEKDMHDWGQGEGGVTYLIEHLTEPGEMVVDPFAGTAVWGQIAASMGRRWRGADIVSGGDSRIAAQ